jgi:hypothetical protein
MPDVGETVRTEEEDLSTAAGQKKKIFILLLFLHSTFLTVFSTSICFSNSATLNLGYLVWFNSNIDLHCNGIILKKLAVILERYRTYE